jgi:hypothetical protein
MAEDLQKVTLNLTKSDYARLAVLHPGTPKAQVIRMVIEAYITAAEVGGQMVLDKVKAQP